jgi:DNA-binding MarR family transcriptional regulator
MQPSGSDTTAALRPASVDAVLGALMTIGRILRQRISSDSLEPGTFWLLKSLASQGSMRVTDLAGCAHLDTSTVSRHVAQLQRAGLIERTRDPADGRAQRVELTPSGRHQLTESLALRHALLTKSMQHWDIEDIAELDRLLARFVGDLNNLNQDLENA